MDFHYATIVENVRFKCTRIVLSQSKTIFQLCATIFDFHIAWFHFSDAFAANLFPKAHQKLAKLLRTHFEIMLEKRKRKRN